MALEAFDSDTVFKDKYRNLKRKLKFLIYENECFSMEIRNMEKRLLRILKDRTFLLDMLTQHEAGSPAFESSDDDLTDSSDGEMKLQHKSSDRKKKMKTERGTKKTPGIPSKPRRKPPNKLDKKNSAKPDTVANLLMEDSLSSNKQEVASKTGHMTPEEVWRMLGKPTAKASGAVAGGQRSTPLCVPAMVVIDEIPAPSAGFTVMLTEGCPFSIVFLT
uniref:EOG090X0LZH n=1 Tax=Ceriodaphnia reticulata TaxID=302197 RepID=A0A4Y7LUV9_9CRUS|nr:EOG090X0LZH [Ceriodaphnia reticulata]SVE73348.1 EOG090X0LZH [Ceriodaphnia reticulata]